MKTKNFHRYCDWETNDYANINTLFGTRFIEKSKKVTPAFKFYKTFTHLSGANQAISAPKFRFVPKAYKTFLLFAPAFIL